MRKKTAKVSRIVIKRRTGNREKPGRRVCARLTENPGIRLEAGPLNRAHLVADFLHLQRKLGRRPVIGDFLQHCHTPKVLDRAFGRPGWRRLIKAVGKEALPKNSRSGLTAEHLIEDYLDAEKSLGRKPSYSHFHELHRHSMKVLVRVFGKPGWTKLRKAADKAMRKQFKEQRLGSKAAVGTTERAHARRAEAEILNEIRASYSALLKANRVLRRKTLSRKALKQTWKLRAQLNDLFYEIGRAISVEEAFQSVGRVERSKTRHKKVARDIDARVA